ncbi:MAG TPA: lysophospholipid acyltransferase family protein [Candidatus Limnocylindria bacterium]|jgi:KDO2-lipid IV(A) lauroyltransferase|nr:lysophospholipid acyltransferase family protein [Candidatus Limnocylindria bacterium]
MGLRDHLVGGLLYWSWRVGASLVQRLPTRLVYLGAILGGEIAYLGWRSKREITKRNFAVVLARPADHPDVARVARRAFRNFAKYLTEIMRFPSMGSDDLRALVEIDPTSLEHLQAARDHGRGLIFVSAHFGNFELGGARIAQDIPLTVVADALENQRLMDFLVTNRGHKNVHILPPQGATRPVLAALRRNEMVGLMIDLGPRAHELENVEAIFFGVRTHFPTVAAALARVSGAPIVVAAVRRDRDNTFKGVALSPIFVERTKQAAHDIERATQSIVHALEGLVRPDPDQWYIFRPMWPAPLDAAT